MLVMPMTPSEEAAAMPRNNPVFTSRSNCDIYSVNIIVQDNT